MLLEAKADQDGTMEAPQELLAALAAHGEALAAELRALDDMPQAKLTPASVFDRAKPPGSVAQQRGVICRLRCCGKPIDQKCNDRTGDAACPTHVEAARMLRSKIAEQHGSAACRAKAEQTLAEEGSGSSGPVESAFSVMMGAQLVRQRAGSELMQAEEDLQLLRSRLAAAEERLEAAQVEARRVGLGAKKPRAPEWQGREYSAWDKIETWRQEEGRMGQGMGLLGCRNPQIHVCSDSCMFRLHVCSDSDPQGRQVRLFMYNYVTCEAWKIA